MQQIDKQLFDLYVIDINIPEFHGLELLRYIRKTDILTPVIIITASLEIENFLTAFKYGCNEYIKKPFHLKELDIRINKLLSITKKDTLMFTKDFYYDLSREIFIYKKNPISLRYKEKRFCTLMTKNINTYVSFDAIHDYVWEGEIKDIYPLRQLISELRKKLPLGILKTKVKIGYMLQIPMK